jgi:diketogulonate reductase-like aldo/keto reductase
MQRTILRRRLRDLYSRFDRRQEKAVELRRFGSVARDVPSIGQGTWYFEQAPRRSAIAALRRGLDLGMTHVDTAELYGAGVAEEIVGEAIEGRRDEVFLVSKVMPQNASRRGTIAACEQSLKRLKTDRLECYLLHWRGRHPHEDTIAAFEELRAGGKILSWGLSNFDAPHLEQARKVAGDGKIACNQVLYHLEERGIEHAVLPWCESHGVALVGYSPFGSGRFPSSKVLGEIAKSHGATPRQVALAFLTRRPALFAIPKASSPAHVEENAAAADLELADSELAQIEAAFPLGRRPRSLPTL